MAQRNLGAALAPAIIGLAKKARDASAVSTTPIVTDVATKVADAWAEKKATAIVDGTVGWLESRGVHVRPDGELQGLLGGALKGLGWATQVIAANGLGFAIGGALSTVLQPFFQEMANDAWGASPTLPLTAADAAQLVRRGEMSPAEAAAEARMSGVNGERFQHMVRLTRTFPAVGEILELVNRGELDPDQGMHRMMELGLDQEDAVTLLALRERVAPATDVLRWAVREVFNPQLRAKYGYDAEYPATAEPDAERAGIFPPVLRNYWAAHWDLPSPQQGYTMMHRGEITEQELAELLKALDYPTFWRDKLAAISHLVPGRIDLRRMYDHGVKSKEEVLRGYRALGYTPQDAATLTEFAVALATEEERKLTKAEILQLFEAGTYSREEAERDLVDLGYDRDDADAMLAFYEYRQRKRLRDATIGRIRSAYVGRKISEEDAQQLLDRVPAPAKERDLLLATWDIERDATTRELTEAQARALWIRGIRDEAYYRGWLIEHGFSEQEADDLVRLYTPREEEGT